MAITTPTPPGVHLLAPRPADPAGTSRQPGHDARLLLSTPTVAVRDVACPGVRKDESDEGYASRTWLVFPYRGVYVCRVGAKEVVADANQLMILNKSEPYRVSHPTVTGHATLSVGVDAATLFTLAPVEYRDTRGWLTLHRPALRIDARTQLLAAQLRQRLIRGSIGSPEAETLALQLVRQALRRNAPHDPGPSPGRPGMIADQVKMLLSADPWRRWNLAEIADEVCVAPVYLTDIFRRAEGTPLYSYHLRLRLAFALTVLAECDDLTRLAIDLGFNSHSHFSAAFKKTFGQSPSEFKRSINGPPDPGISADDQVAKDFDNAVAALTATVVA
jgi:AraC family transcriptional regulator